VNQAKGPKDIFDEGPVIEAEMLASRARGKKGTSGNAFSFFF
jgi:hypothetical protein